MNDDFDIVDIIINTIEEELGIPCFFMRCNEDLTCPYVIFSVTNNVDSDRFDGKYISDYYDLDITLWYTNPKDGCLWRMIKQSLQEKGFKYKKSYDTIDENTNEMVGINVYYGRLMEFSYKRFIY